MSKIRINRELRTGGVSSFYGVYPDSQVMSETEIVVLAPTNESYGPHIRFPKIEYQDESCWVNEEI